MNYQAFQIHLKMQIKNQNVLITHIHLEEYAVIQMIMEIKLVVKQILIVTELVNTIMKIYIENVLL